MGPPSSKSFRVHVMPLGCAGITVDRYGRAETFNSPHHEVSAVAVISRRKETYGVTQSSCLLRKSPTKDANSSRERFLALWTDPGVASTITFNVELQEPLTRNGSIVRSAASSRLISKDFEIYIGIKCDGQTPIPIAAANMSLRAGMKSQTYDLPLYPVDNVNLDSFQSSGNEEKKDDALSYNGTKSNMHTAYGIDCLDALLRVSIAIEEISILSRPEEDSKRIEQKDEMIEIVNLPVKEPSKPDPRVTHSIQDLGNKGKQESGTKKRWTEQAFESVPEFVKGKTVFNDSSRKIQLQRGPDVSMVDASECINKASPQKLSEGQQEQPREMNSTSKKTRLIKTTIFAVEESQQIPDNPMDDETSVDGDTFETADDTVASRDTFYSFWTHLKKVERLVERIPLPECKVLDIAVDLGFDYEDESTSYRRDSVSKESMTKTLKDAYQYTQNRCSVLPNCALWWNADNAKEAEASKHAGGSVITHQNTFETESSDSGQPGAIPTVPLRDPPAGVARDVLFDESHVPSSSMHDTSSGSNGRTCLNNDSLDKDVSFNKCFPSSRSNPERDQKFIPMDIFACLSKETIDDAPAKKPLPKIIRLSCINPVNTSGLVPRACEASVGSKSDDSPNNVADFPISTSNYENRLVGNIRNILTCGNVLDQPQQPIVSKLEARDPPVHVIKGFAHFDGDGSSLGELTLTTLERQLDVDHGKSHAHTKNGSKDKKMRTAPGRGLIARLGCSKRTQGNSDCPFDEDDNYLTTHLNEADKVSPEMHAAAGLAWAKQAAERTNLNRRRHGRVIS